MPDNRSTDYIGKSDYKSLEDKIKELKSTLDDLSTKLAASRDLRYADVDLEGERKAGRLQPDELYVPQHIIDTNIRREQSPYVQYITQSPRAVICQHQVDSTVDLSLLDTDLTKKIRYDGWQLSQFSNIDGFQANGYSIMEVVMDEENPGHIGHETVQLSDFAFISDTRDIQSVEMTARTYHFTRTKLIALCGDGTDPTTHWNRAEVDKVIGRDPTNVSPAANFDIKDRSLYDVFKIMFKLNGVVQVAWACPEVCSDWLRIPRPLFIGRRRLSDQQPSTIVNVVKKMMGQQPTLPSSENVYEKRYPYILYPYLISENDTISQLKGRVFLDQDLQEAVSSLVSSTVTQARRASGLYFSKDTEDPNDDVLQQKNTFFRQGALINGKIKQFQVTPPAAEMFSAIQMLVASNQNETSQVNFAVNNRKDSRKTAAEVNTSEKQQQQLSTVQVVLFAIALTQMYRLMTEVIVSRVKTGLITVDEKVRPLYDMPFVVKPSGDTDVIEKQQLINQMMMTWQVVQGTPIANVFLSDLLTLMFPDRAPNYLKVMQQAQQQAQSQQAQQQAFMMNLMAQMANGIVSLSEKPEMFSETGKIHALPVLKNSADQLKQLHEKFSTPQPTPQ